MTRKRSKRQAQSGAGKPRQKVNRNDAEGVMTQLILKLFKTQQFVCADDLHQWLDVPADCMKFVAHVFRGLQFRGVIRIVKIVNTPRDGQHGNRIAIWELVPNAGTDSVTVNRPRKPHGDRGSNAATVSR
ncbi:MAG: hypothetical protein R3C17_00365 [Planctomycetaceae bacterium]